MPRLTSYASKGMTAFQGALRQKVFIIDNHSETKRRMSQRLDG